MAARTKRAAVYFDADLHKALRRKAAEASRSVTKPVKEAVKQAPARGAADRASFDARADKPLIGCAESVERLKTGGRL